MSDYDDDYDDRPGTPLDDLSKKALRQMVRDMEAQLQRARGETLEVRQESAERDRRLRALTAEVEKMRQHWRPVPIAHEWEPRDQQCALCDEPRDAARHTARRIPMDTAL